MNEVLVQKKGYSVWITLNRPEASNAYTIAMIETLVAELRRADLDSSVRAIVITGAGKNFCAGGDVKAMLNRTGMFAGEPNELRETYHKGIQQIPLTIESLKTPLIAMVNGAAVGAGCDLAAMCDLRIGSTWASFAETFAKVGLVPGDGGAYFLTRLIGYGKAMELFLTCRTVDAEEALKIGLLNEIVRDPLNLEARTEELVEKITGLPPIAVQMTKRAVGHGYQSDLGSHLELMAAYQGITQRTIDHSNAVEALINKTKTLFDHK